MYAADDFEIRNLTFHYPDGKTALRNISLAVHAGETVGLIGPNGAGKSTLLWHLNGLLPGRDDYEHHHFHGNGQRHVHDRGPQVWVGGIPVQDRFLPEIRRRVGLLFQDPESQLFCPTVMDDVVFGPTNLGYSRQESQEIAVRCLAAVELSGIEDRLPHHLSVGEQKRVCLAGVLACQPSILALDEPTGSLDPAGRRQLMNLLRELPQTKLIATHDLDLVVELCDRVFMLDEGALYAEGPARDVLANEPLLNEHRLEMPWSLRQGNGEARMEV